jgi:hypothetical protein
MTTAGKTKAAIEARALQLVFPVPDDWKNIVRDLKLTKVRENELEITIRHALADIEKYLAIKRKQLPRDILVPALKRLEKALGKVQSEMARNERLVSHFLPNKTLEFIGESFTFTAIKKAVTKGVFTIIFDDDIQNRIERNISMTMADLEERYRNERIRLGYEHGGKILKHFIDVIHADLKSWVELDRRNTGGRPADIYRTYIIQRFAERALWIIGKEATTTAKGKFEKLCAEVLPACGFSSEGIEKAIEAVLAKRAGRKPKSAYSAQRGPNDKRQSSPRNRR